MTCEWAIFLSGSGADRRPRFTSSGRCQSLSCCSSAESDPIASAKENQICVTGWLPWLWRQKLNAFCPRPAEKSSSSPSLFLRHCHCPFIFFFFPNTVWHNSSVGGSVSLKLWLCSGKFAAMKALLFYDKKDPQTLSTMVDTLLLEFLAVNCKEKTCGEVNQQKHWSKWRYNTT